MRENLNQKVLTVGVVRALAFQIWGKQSTKFLTIVISLQVIFSIALLILSPKTLEDEIAQGFNLTIFSINMTKALFGVISAMACMYIALHCIEDKEINTGAAIKQSFAMFFIYLFTMIIMTFATGLLTLCLIIPGLIFAVYWIYTPQIVLNENKRFIDAMSESKKLVKGRWWRTVANTMLPLWPFMLLFIGIALAGTFAGNPIIMNGILAIATDLIAPLSICVMTIAYWNMKECPHHEAEPKAVST